MNWTTEATEGKKTSLNSFSFYVKVYHLKDQQLSHEELPTL